MTPLEAAIVSACNRAARRQTVITALCYAILGAALAIALTGCGKVDPPPDMPIRWVQGIGIMVEDGAPAWTADDAATLDAIRIGAEHVGGTLDDLQGWIVVFRARATQNTSCDSPDQHQISRGCEHDSGWIDIVTYVPETLSTDNVAVSVYQTALIHEVAHVIIHDPCHRDASWMDFEAASQATPQHWLNPPWIWESEPTC